MAYNFRRGDRDQPFLLPPDLRDWLPNNHLAWFVLDVVDQLDLEPFLHTYRADGHGHPAYDPKTLLSVLLYAYAIGVRSSRQIERRCREDLAFRVNARDFLCWAVARRLAVDLDLPPPPKDRPTRPIDGDQRWTVARRLLIDTGLDPADRVAGLLVLCYAQPATTISRLTLDRITHHPGRVHLQLGSSPALLPNPLADLLLELAAARKGNATVGTRQPRHGCSPAGPQAAPSAPTGSRSASAASASRPAPAEPQRCWTWPPNSPSACSRACSASAQAPPPAGEPAPAAPGAATPPTSPGEGNPHRPDILPGDR